VAAIQAAAVEVDLDQVLRPQLALEQAARGDQQSARSQLEGDVAVHPRDETRLPQAAAAADDIVSGIGDRHRAKVTGHETADPP
jgi:hypothetical protein